MKNQKESKKVSPKKKIRRVHLPNKPLLILQPKLLTQVNFLHRYVGKDEWSGILFYELEGSINDIDNLIFKANHFMLKDIGTSSYTSYEFDETVIDYFDEYPEAEEMKMGMLHSHHNMSNFFSSTDLGELDDNTEHHNYYLSVIVSFDCDYHAKLAFRGVPQKITVKGDDGKPTEINVSNDESEDIVYICDVDVVLPVSDFEYKQYQKIKEEKKKAEKAQKKQQASWNQNQVGWGTYPYVNGYGQKYAQPAKSITKTDDKSNSFTNSKLVQQATSRLVLFDLYKETDINMFLAFKRMSESFDEENAGELTAYIDGLEEVLDTIVQQHFGSGTMDDIMEFCDTALDELENIDETPFIKAFIEMLKFNSSKYDDVFDEEEYII